MTEARCDLQAQNVYHLALSRKRLLTLISVVIPSIGRICSFIFLYLYKERKSNKYFLPLLPRTLLKFVNPGDRHISSSLGLGLVTVNCLPS